MFTSDAIPSRLWEYLIATVLIILAPGPSVLFTIARAIAWGRVAAIATVIGNAFGMFLVSVLVAFGLGPLLQSSKLFYNGIQWAGGAYLIYLGYAAIAASRVDAQGMQKTEGSKPSFFTSLKNGFWVGVLNPKSVVFFAAILPQFVDQEKNNVTAQLLLLGAIFATVALISDGSYGLLAGTVRSWLAGDVKRLIFMRRFGGLVMIGLGVFTIFSALVIG
ncbi:Threonine/homoserine/homoserine lactone efflux protein [Candidatus Nanopelagicus limnes]|uniref:Threonine/homoserine/homoserine lactone efflux protein n=1 Tax=Candidatus Nanopelagicus limnae TaxID=1884634 RepID=A0A249JXK2_9ACTN|nr:LysE family translocator [Candidatus Nanopelagicus limnes]ASY09242.1 Threonine/homoserine/homoserine lactone efflux protein [Candidatus Nanopelagicus limnes]